MGAEAKDEKQQEAGGKSAQIKQALLQAHLFESRLTGLGFRACPSLGDVVSSCASIPPLSSTFRPPLRVVLFLVLVLGRVHSDSLGSLQGWTRCEEMA